MKKYVKPTLEKRETFSAATALKCISNCMPN